MRITVSFGADISGLSTISKPPLDRRFCQNQQFATHSFNSKLRDECLNEHVFLTLAEARETIEAWRHDYNHLRQHGSLGALTPIEFAMLKGQEHQPAQEGDIPGRLYL